ncbi:acyl-CoA dehydrogenase [Mycolicibacterium sphagni]|nr:acyl-CoA dehydrogenase [Mycolicibacterium sphagni]
MIESEVFRIFDQIAAEGAGVPVALSDRLAELGWADIEDAYPASACDEVLFRAQAISLANTDCLDRLMLRELAGALPERVDGLVLPAIADGHWPMSTAQHVEGIATGTVTGRVAVPVSGPSNTVLLGITDLDALHHRKLDTFDASLCWTHLSGAIDPVVDATIPWRAAVRAAHCALATELLAVTGAMLDLAVEHVCSRVQFGKPIGAYQSPRHALAEASAALEGARALRDEARRQGGDFAASIAKASAGRAHRSMSDVAMQVCGAIGLTAEHRLHRYVQRGFHLDALLGSYRLLEAALAQSLFADEDLDAAVPTVVTWC